MYHPILRPGAQRQLKKIGYADLVIGLPSYKNGWSAAQVARVALEGVRQYYPALRTVLVNADAGLEATTRRAVMAQVSDNGHNNIIVSGRYEGLLGWGSAIAALLDAALALDARAIIILDTQTTSISPEWVAGLAHLILENKADLVIPRYRQWLLPQGGLSDLITYPLFRALWGRSLRRPAAPDFALSPQLATALLDEDVWGTAVATFGLPPWLTSYGIVHEWRVVQSALRGKNSLTGSESGKSTKNTELQFKARFEDVLTVLFSLAQRYENYWQNVNSVRSLPTLTHFAADPTPPELLGTTFIVDTEHVVSETGSMPSPPTEIWKSAGLPTEENTTRLLDELALGWIEYRALWQRVLTTENLAQVEALAALPVDRFYFPADLWARIVYDFTVVFNKGDADPAQIVASLFPLYQGRLAAFQQEVAGLAPVGREGTVAAQAVEFEEACLYLKERWQAYQPYP